MSCVDCGICGESIDLNQSGYTTGFAVDGKTYAHIACWVQDRPNPTDGLDATDVDFDLHPIVWIWDEVIAGNKVDVTVRMYYSDMFCWVAEFDDGDFENTRTGICSTGIGTTLEAAKREATGFIMWHLMRY